MDTKYTDVTILGNLSANFISVPGSGNSTEWHNKITSGASVDVSRIGAQTYLNVNIKGSFDGPQASPCKLPYLLTETNGKVVGLRSGYNGVRHKQFYFTADDNSLNNLKSTDNEYRPPYLSPTEYVHEIIDGNEHGIYIQVKDEANIAVNKFYWIDINNTLDPSFHAIRKDLTALATANSLYNGTGTIVYCKEHDLYLTVHRPMSDDLLTKTITYRVYNSTLNLLGTYTKTVGTIGSGANVILTDTNTTTWSSFNVQHNSQQRPQIRYNVAGNNITISDLNEFIIWRSIGVWRVNYNSVFNYNVLTNTFTEEFATPHTYNPDDPTTFVSPFYPWRFTGWGGKGMNTSLRRDPNNADIVFETAKYWGESPLQFIVKSYKINAGSTWNDVVRLPYSANMTPLDAISNGEYIPDDASLLGKKIEAVHFYSPTKIACTAYSKLPNQSLSLKSLIASIGNINNRRTINAANDALETPTSVILDPYTALSGPTITTLDSVGNMRVKRLDGLVYKELDADTGTYTNNNIITLPANFNGQVDALLTADPIYTARPAATSHKASNVFHITGDLFLHTFSYVTNLTSYAIYCRLLQLTAGVVNWLGAAHTVLLTNNAASSVSHVGNWSNSAGIYFSAGGTVYMIFTPPGIGNTTGNQNFSFVATINTTTPSIVTNQEVGDGNGSWHYRTVGIHPRFGPNLMHSHVDSYAKIKMYLRNRTSIIETLDAKMIACFNDMLASAKAFSNLDMLYAITIQAATGFLLYNSEISAFINGKEYKIDTGSSDMNDSTLWLGSKPASLQNITAYVYVALNKNTAKIMFSSIKSALTYGSILIGNVKTGITGIVSTDIKSTTVIGKYLQTTDEGIVINSENFSLKNSNLIEYTVSVKTQTFTVGNDTLTLASSDSGGVITISQTSTSAGRILVPAGLPVGYSVMIVNRSNQTVTIESTAVGGATVVNVNGNTQITGQYGVCNLIFIDNNTALISGDLS